MFKVVRITERATLPTRGSEHAAGFDLYASAAVAIPPWSRALVATDLAMQISWGMYGRIAARSGLAARHGIDVSAGVIDSDYRGPVQVLLVNNSDVPFEVKRGDRIAQLILEQHYCGPAIEVTAVSELEATGRGADGFGSTGR